MQYNITYRNKDNSIQVIVSYKDSAGKWRQKSEQGFTKKGEAKKAADKILEELKERHALQLNPELEGITFGEFTEMLLEHLALHKEYGTILTYKNALRKFENLKKMELSRITALHVQVGVDGMVQEGLKVSTIKEYCVKLKTVFNKAIQPYKIITNNPVTNLTIPESKEETKIKALTKKELKKVLSGIDNKKHYIASLLAAKCGLRLGEIAGLTRGDLNFKKKTVSINKQWKKLKDGEMGFGPVKRKNSNRTVPLPESVIKELKEYIKYSPANIDGRIAPYATIESMSASLKKQYRKTGFKISAHILRHTYATMLIASGVDFKTAAELLGHSVEQTMKTYAHITDDMMARATKKINTIFD